MKQFNFLWLIWCVACLECSGAATNREAWSRTFPQANLVSLFPDHLGHTAVVMSSTGSNVVVLLDSTGTTTTSASLPTTTDLPSPVQAAAADSWGNIYLSGQANPPASYVSTVRFRQNLASVAWTNTVLLTNPVAPGRLAAVRQIVADDSGNVYCLGRFNQYTGDIDQFALSVGPDGARWFDVFNPDQDNDFDKGIALLKAGDGSLFAVGYSDHYSPSGSSVLVRRFTPNGQMLWASNYLAPSKGSSYAFSDTPAAAVLDSQYRVVIAGGRIEGFDRGYFVMQVSSTGQVLWRTVFNNTEDNFAATDADVDVDDNVIVTGPAGTLKFSPSGTLLWHSPEVGAAVRFTQKQTIVLSGSVRDGNGPRAVQTTELFSDGQLCWRARFNGAPGSDKNFASLLIDLTGAIYVGVNATDNTTTILSYRELPRLNVKVIDASQVTVSWPVSETNCILTTATNLDAEPWTMVTNTPVLVGNEWNVTLPSTSAPTFFKLELR